MRSSKSILMRSALVLFASVLASCQLFRQSSAAGSAKFVSEADGYVSESAPSNNYGSSADIFVGAAPVSYGYFKFNVTGSKKIVSATFKIYSKSNSAPGITVKRVADNSWNENSLAFNNAPAMGSTIANQANLKAKDWVTVDVTSYVTGSGTYSIGVTSTDSSTLDLAARESKGHQPQLVVVFANPTLAPPTSTVAVVNTPANTPTAPALLGTPTPAAASGSGNVFYVSTSGNDANPGTLSLPWRTVQKAADTLVAGDTVLIRAGTYASTARITPRNSGTASAYITYKAYPGEHPVIVTDAGQGFFIAGTSTSKKGYIEINGLTVTARAVPFTTESCGTGIYVEYAHHIRILNNVVKDSGGSGITFETGSDYALIQGNIVTGNTWGCSSWRGSAINFHRIMWYDQAAGYHNIARNNLVYHNYHDPKYVLNHSDGNAFTVDESNKMNASGTNPPVLIENNVAFDNAGPCLNVFYSSNTLFRDNTCYHNITDPYIADREITITGSSAIQAYNNILVPLSGHDAASQYSSSNLSLDYNLAYGGRFLVGGAHDILADPKFVNASIDPSTANFHLSLGSPAIDKGLGSQSAAVDYAGVARPQGAGCDIGAYEYK